MELRDRWNHLLPDAQRLGEDLLARYAESHRHYHDQRHLAEVLRAIDELAGSAEDADAVRLAAWFHDAIYDTDADPGENEEVSAQLAEAELSAYGVDPDRVAEIGRLVRLTATHKPDPDDANGRVLSDADLWILSSDEKRYQEYAAGVRQEYLHVPDREFAAGRTAVLERLAATPLYATEHARSRWEAAARENIDREMAELLPRTVRPLAGLVPLIYVGSAAGAIVAASVLFGRGLGAAPSWPAPAGEQAGTPLWAPIAGTAVATGLACAWFRGVPTRVMSGIAALLAVAGAAGIAGSWLRWPESRPGAALSDRWPYLLLASITVLLAGALLGLGRRLRSTVMYSGTPSLALGAPATVACAVLLGWILVAAGPPFTQARLERANTVSSTAADHPGNSPVRLDGTLAWANNNAPAVGELAGTAGGVAELRPDGVVMYDAAEGDIRWRYARSDIDDAAGPAGRGLMVSADGRTVAVHLPYRGPGVRRDINLPTYAVLDAVSGNPLSEVHTDGVALAVNQERIIVAKGNYVVSYQVGGPGEWRHRTNCEVVKGAIVDGRVVVVDACGGQGAVIRGLDAANGKQRWELDLSTQFEVGGDTDPRNWIGDLTAVPGTRAVSGLVWTAAGGGTLQQWAVDAGEGRLIWVAAMPGKSRPRLGPNGCDAQLAATQASIVLVTCQGAPGQPQYDIAAANPADGTPQWHHRIPVPAGLHQPGFPHEGFALLPDGRMITVSPQPSSGGGCVPVMIGTAGIRPREFAKHASTARPTTCSRPRVTVAGGRPVISDGTRLYALR